MKDPTGVALLRGKENLRHIMDAKKMLEKKLADNLSWESGAWKDDVKVLRLSQDKLMDIYALEISET